MILLNSCGTSETPHLNNPESAIFGNANESVSPNNILGFIAFDLVGGMFSTSSQVIEKSVIKNGDSTPLPLSKAQTSTKPIQEMPIDTSFAFSGAGGYGKLTITANGNGIKIFPSPTSPNPEFYKFNPLTLRFFFFNYTYYNDCLGKIQVDGELSCNVVGSYDIYKKVFLGNVSCQNGYKEDNRPLLYITQEANYEVTLNALLKIDGNPFYFESYSYSGQIMVDGVLSDIQTSITSQGTCQK